MYSDSFELQILINGKAIKEYSHEGRSFIEARKGTQYTLKLRNNSPTRAMAIFSVDGLDVLKGKPAEQAENGYIVDSYDSIEIKGYRISDTDVAAFIFTDGKNSYAVSQGKENNNGVIGVRVISEKEKPKAVYNNLPFWGGTVGITGSFSLHRPIRSKNLGQNVNMCSSPIETKPDMASLTSYTNSTPQLDMGTGWGQKVEDSVKKVEFEIGALVTEMELFYASREALVKMGIDFNPKKKVTSAFPKAFNDYCKPPKGWK